MRTIVKIIKPERGIPIPPLNPNQILWGPALKKLEIMDSFIVNTHAEVAGILRAARKNGMIVTSRKISKGGFRIWRIE